MQPKPAKMKDSASAGPAFWAAATPVSTKIPVPMTPPIPSSVSWVAVSARRSSLPEASCACSSSMDFVASSCDAMKPPVFVRGTLHKHPGESEARAVRGAPVASLASGLAQLRWHVRRDQTQELCVNLRRARHDMTRLLVVAAGERADAAAGFLDEECAGRRVPGRKPDLPERINASRGHVGEVERRGARATHPGGLLGHRAQHAHVGIEVFHVGAIGEAGRHQRAIEGARLADANAMVLQMR